MNENNANFTPAAPNFKTLVRMCFQGLTNFPYIEEDFDALTNYELLSKVVEYLNQVISNNNEQNTLMTGLYNAYVSLQNYVNDYFDNLDVQDEINNKLDDMVEAGTLQEIIADYLNSKAVFGYDNVASMKTSTNLINGSYARTLGYYNKNDGGSALYKIRTITNDDIVNEMDIIALDDNTLIAELIDDVNNVLCYGVSLTDANSNNDDIIYYVLNKHKYAYCKSPITLHTTLEIDIPYSKFVFNNITYDGNDTGIILNHQNIELIGQRLESTVKSALRLGKDKITANCNININIIKGEDNGVILGGSQGTLNSTLNIGRLEYKNHGLFFDLSQKYVGQIALYNTAFADNSSLTENYAIYMDCSNNGMTGLDLYNISLESAKGGIYAYTTGTNTAHFLEHLNVFGCRLAEFSLNNHHKALKLISPNNSTILLEGEFDFDAANTDAFDFTEFNSAIQSGYRLNGIIRNPNYTDHTQTAFIGKEGTIKGKKLVITKPYNQYLNYSSPTNYIILTSELTLLSGTSSNAVIRVNTTDFSVNGTYTVFVNSSNISKITFADQSGNVLREVSSVQPADTYTIICGNLTNGSTQLLFHVNNPGFIYTA